MTLREDLAEFSNRMRDYVETGIKLNQMGMPRPDEDAQAAQERSETTQRFQRAHTIALLTQISAQLLWIQRAMAEKLGDDAG